MDADIILFAVVLGVIFLADCICGTYANYKLRKVQTLDVLWNEYPQDKRH